MSEEISSVLPDLSDLSNGAVWMVRYLDPFGFTCQLSLDGRSGTEVLSKGQIAIGKLLETGCKPLERKTDPIKPAQEKESPVVCPIHQTTMRQYAKGERSWYAHRLESGKWCTGKAEKA